jgi:hypothetical protein
VERLRSDPRSAATWLHRLRDLPLAAAALLAIATLGAFFVVSTAQFETNDDVLMSWIADGTLLGEPSRHLVFTNLVIGQALSSLYRLAEGVHWYLVYLWSLHLVALTAVLYTVIADRRLRLVPHGALVGVLVAVVWWGAWMQLQFTSTALLLAFSGVILHLFGPEGRSGERASAAAGLMVGVASLVRIQTMALAASVPLLVFALLFRRIALRRQLVFGAVAVVVVLGGALYHWASYRADGAWHEYVAFNGARGELHDTPRLKEIEEIEPIVAEVAGWSRNDLDTFANWFFFDSETFSRPVLERVADAIPSTTIPGGFIYRARQLWAPTIVLLALFGLALPASNRRERMTLIGTVLVVAGLALYLLATAKLPIRLTLPVIGFLGLLAILLPGRTDDAAPPWPWSRSGIRQPMVGMAGLVVATAVVSLIWQIGFESRTNAAASRQLADAFHDAASIDPDGRFVLWASDFQLEDYSPTDPPNLPEISLISSGWLIGSPMLERRLADLGLTDVYRSIAQEADVFLLTPDPDIVMRVFETYVDEHFTFDGELVTVADLPGGRVLLRGASRE